ncbi:hypothetical protein [Paraclostridium bifermentans]|uniref:hypothetical protein n=1 Tax=Paraclostridium bifermentans TaxID=1490 RepID=UPI00374E6FFC
MKDLGFYTIDKKEIETRVKKAGLEGVFNKKIIKKIKGDNFGYLLLFMIKDEA